MHHGWLTGSRTDTGLQRNRDSLATVDAQPDLDWVDDDRKVQRRWELESREGACFWWSSERADFYCEDDEEIDVGDRLRLLDKARERLRGELAPNSFLPSFEVRPVSAVRR